MTLARESLDHFTAEGPGGAGDQVRHGIGEAQRLDGRGMLVHQGARAFALWTGGTTPSAAIIEAMRGALEAALAGT